jgi:hypothetical protein
MFSGFSANRCGEQTTITIVDKFDLRPDFYRSFDAGAQTSVRQNPFGRIRDQNGVVKYPA